MGVVLMAREEWIRVQSEEELRPGMAVQLRPCKWCGRKAETFFLGDAEKADAFVYRPDGSFGPSSSTVAYHVRGRCGAFADDEYRWQPGNAIRRGKVFRLNDLPGDQATEAARPKALERVRP